MFKNEKFIVVHSESIANQLIASGFYLLSSICGVYTFVNNQNFNFNFSNIDKTMLHFTNKINI